MYDVEKLEQLQLEYDLFDVEFIESMDDVLSYLHCSREIINREAAYSKVQRDRNNIDKFFARTLSPVLKFHKTFPKYHYYIDDNDMLDLADEVSNGYLASFDRLIGIVSTDNFSNIYRLGRFTMEKYDRDFRTISGFRVKARNNGEYFGKNVDIYGKSFFDFFDSTIVRESGYGSAIQFYK